MSNRTKDERARRMNREEARIGAAKAARVLVKAISTDTDYAQGEAEVGAVAPSTWLCTKNWNAGLQARAAYHPSIVLGNG